MKPLNYFHRWTFIGLCWMFSLSASAQVFELPTTLYADVVASGSRTVWAASVNTQGVISDLDFTYLYNPQNHQFENVWGPVRDYPTILATGGGNIFQPDESWGHFYTHGTYRFDPGMRQWQQNTPTFGYYPHAQEIVVGVGYGDNCHPYEVWRIMININNAPYLDRYDYCAGLFIEFDTPQNLSRVAIGGGEIWALDASNQVYRFDGIAQQFNLMPGTLLQIAVGVDGVWGLSADGGAYEFNAITQSWDRIPAPTLVEIWAGADGVFAKRCKPIILERGTPAPAPAASANGPRVTIGPGSDCKDEMMRYEPVTRHFVSIASPYRPDILSVGTGAGAWGILSYIHWILRWAE
jgi:hypothetical protein